jgi:simple sugar transport system ATP-binding protein
VEGNWQVALGELLSGLAVLNRGRVEVEGQRVRPVASELLRAGVGIIPEDRHRSGCVLQMSVADNLVAADLHQYVRGRFLLDRGAIQERARELIEQYDIAATSPHALMSSLSGGSQQRVVVARELSRNPKVLIAAQPTRGLDVGAVEYMSERLRQAALDGVGILLVSTDLEEIIAVSDRIVVIQGGRNVGEMLRGQVSVEQLGLLMGGHRS